MKVVSYTALHYGKEYLYWAIKSVIDQVDEHHIIYSPIGSHGYRTDIPCPDTRAELYAEAERAAGDKLRWHNGEWAYEGLQRDSIHQYAPDADVILVVDADEIWSEGLAAHCIQVASSNAIICRWRIPIIHFWRSFHKAILRDPAFPERVIRGLGRGSFVETLQFRTPICHMGYAQRPAIVEYKWRIHGHLGEYRRDMDWFKDKYLANAQTDTHPVGSEYWSPEPVNPADYMPDFMRNHPSWDKAVIE